MNFLKNLKEEIALAKIAENKIEKPNRPFQVFDGPRSKRDADPFKNQKIEIQLRRGITGVFALVISSAAYLHFVKTRNAY